MNEKNVIAYELVGSEEVNHKIREGWQPWGSAVVTPVAVFQPMVAYSKTISPIQKADEEVMPLERGANGQWKIKGVTQEESDAIMAESRRVVADWKASRAKEQ